MVNFGGLPMADLGEDRDGLTLDRLHFQTALPRIDGQASASSMRPS